MCGRFTLATVGQDLVEQFHLSGVPDLVPRYNIAPTQPVAVVRHNPQSVRELTFLHWGLVPSWASDPKIGARMINARSETVSEKPAFRAAFRRRRCLVPADGFYEWLKLERGKQPFFVRMRGGPPFAFAGLWEVWQSPDGAVLESCTLLTTEPNSLIRPLHNRMPVILPPQAYDLWLDPSVEETSRLQPLLQPYPAEEMEAYPVGWEVNRPENDSPRCVLPLAESWYKESQRV
jgi:putative SOS response-associated peptidase YedK